MDRAAGRLRVHVPVVRLPAREDDPRGCPVDLVTEERLWARSDYDVFCQRVRLVQQGVQWWSERAPPPELGQGTWLEQQIIHAAAGLGQPSPRRPEAPRRVEWEQVEQERIRAAEALWRLASPGRT